MTTVRVKRVYEDVSGDDGYRVLVDRVWPRGISKERAHVDEWDKEVGPSTGLRTWFGHRPDRFDEFARRYREELDGSPALAHLREVVADHDVVTLVYSARDEEHNQAVVLAEVLRES
jgi:DNA-3-methyladenine glycosylase